MSHITRRKFLAGSAALVGSAALAPIAPALPVEVPAPTAAAEFACYEEFAQALVKPILREIQEASVMRKILSANAVRTETS